ncbi:hypothetical protein BJX61DRAFT_542287 [Aspergillus egyptiacus]|nr:hypothetical protein BJX61DRAFT_542287 [Aspergillus egyptiacus]
MTLDDSPGSLGPVYFQPYSSAIEEPEIDTIAGYYPQFDESANRNGQNLAWYLNQYFNYCILPDEDSSPTGTGRANFGDLDWGNVYDLNENCEYQVQAVWNMTDIGAPHTVVLMHSGLVGDDQLLRPEVHVIARLMHQRLRLPNSRPSVVTPVLLFSIVGMHHLRVLEAFFDGENLVIRTTQNFDIGQPDRKFFITLSRWWLGFPSSKSTAFL